MIKFLMISVFTISLSLQNSFASTFKYSNEYQLKIEEYKILVNELFNYEKYMYMMIHEIGLKNDQEKAIELYKESHKILRSLNNVPTFHDIAQVNKVIDNYNLITVYYKLHEGKRYIEI